MHSAIPRFQYILRITRHFYSFISYFKKRVKRNVGALSKQHLNDWWTLRFSNNGYFFRLKSLLFYSTTDSLFNFLHYRYCRILKFWVKLLSNKQSLKYKLYTLLVSDIDGGKCNRMNWAYNVKTLLSDLGMNDLWLNQNHIYEF